MTFNIDFDEVRVDIFEQFVSRHEPSIFMFCVKVNLDQPAILFESSADPAILGSGAQTDTQAAPINFNVWIEYKVQSQQAQNFGEQFDWKKRGVRKPGPQKYCVVTDIGPNVDNALGVRHVL